MGGRAYPFLHRGEQVGQGDHRDAGRGIGHRIGQNDASVVGEGARIGDAFGGAVVVALQHALDVRRLIARAISWQCGWRLAPAALPEVMDLGYNLQPLERSRWRSLLAA